MAVAASFSTDVARIGELQVGLPSPIAVLIGIIAFGAALLPDLWLVTKHVTVMAHEGAHAVMGSALGRTVNGITFNRKGEGVTKVSQGGRSGNIAVGAIGYLGPSVFGIGAAELIRVGHVIAVLWFSLLALAILMMPLRRSFGVLTVIGAFVFLLIFVSYANVGTQEVGGYSLTWFMLVSGVRQVGEDWTGAGDAGVLRGLIKIPHGFWARFWLLGSLAALVFGATQLI
jgi:Peptidase M50B-like